MNEWNDLEEFLKMVKAIDRYLSQMPLAKKNDIEVTVKVESRYGLLLSLTRNLEIIKYCEKGGWIGKIKQGKSNSDRGSTAHRPEIEKRGEWFYSLE